MIYLAGIEAEVTGDTERALEKYLVSLNSTEITDGKEVRF